MSLHKDLESLPEGDDIRLFREEYPDVYDFVLKVLNGDCDDTVRQAFSDEYGEDVLDDFLQILSGRASSEDIEAFEKYYPGVHVAIKKMLDRHSPPQEALSETLSLRETFKKGDFIGQKYEVFDVLGEGGFGIVYLVYSHETHDVYALKTFRLEYLEDILIRTRFHKEAQVWIDLEHHPYVVRAHLVDQIAGQLYIAMEYIAPDEHGLNTLDGYLRKYPPDLAQTLHWAIQFCYGMEYAYSRGIKAHRDIKPANIMIDHNKNVKISDFGLAGVIYTSGLSDIRTGIRRSLAEGKYQTVIGTAFGTPPYMPPEQFENAAGCDERSDIYSFGIVLYQMVSGGRLPFYPDITESKDDNSFQEWYRLHCKAFIYKLNSPLFQIIRKCLEKDPRKRYRNFRQLRTDLEYLLEQHNGERIYLPNIEDRYSWDTRNRAASLTRLGRYEEAFFYYDKFLKFIGDEGAAFDRTICLYYLHRYEEAISCCDEIISFRPQHLKAWHNKGCCLHELGRYDEALKCFEYALTINPVDTSLLVSMGNTLYKKKKYDEALAAYNRAVEMNDQNSAAWRNKGLCHRQLKNITEEAYCYRKATDIDPLFEDAWLDQGVLFHVSNSKKAIYCYDKVLQLNPKQVTAWINKGKCLYLMGLLNEAIECYKKALDIEPCNIIIWYERGLFEDKLDRRFDALYSYRKFVELASSQDTEKIDYVLKRIKDLQKFPEDGDEGQ